jgi:hypothetical protein
MTTRTDVSETWAPDRDASVPVLTGYQSDWPGAYLAPNRVSIALMTTGMNVSETGPAREGTILNRGGGAS